MSNSGSDDGGVGADDWGRPIDPGPDSICRESSFLSF